MITIKASQKIFTYAEVANLTGICAKHLHDLAKRHRLGFITRAAESLGNQGDRKSTRLNSSHITISYAAFCLKKKNYTTNRRRGVSRCTSPSRKALSDSSWP